MIREFFKHKIVWEENDKFGIDFPYYITSSNRELRLRQNNFPDEHMYTFIVNEETIDFDDLPRNWQIIYKENKNKIS